MSAAMLQTVKDLIEIAQAFFTICAIAVGGYWTYFHFIARRDGLPKADISTQAETRPCGSRYYWIHVKTEVRNIGERKIPILQGYCRLQQCLPPLGDMSYHFEADPKALFCYGAEQTEVEWPQIDKRQWEYPPGTGEIEPGELESFHFDFFVPRTCHVLYVESFFANSAKREMGWRTVNIIELPVPDGKSTHPQRSKRA